LPRIVIGVCRIEAHNVRLPPRSARTSPRVIVSALPGEARRDALAEGGDGRDERWAGGCIHRSRPRAAGARDGDSG